MCTYTARIETLQSALERLAKAITPVPTIGKVTRGVYLWNFERGDGHEYAVDDYGKVIRYNENCWSTDSHDTLLEAWQ